MELALLTPLLIALVVGVADLGRAFHAFIVLENAAREAVRYGASYPGRLTQTVGDPNAERWAWNEVEGSRVAVNSVNYGMAPNPTGEGDVYISVARTGDTIQAEVSYGFHLIAGGFIGVGPITLTGTAQMMVPAGGS